MFAGIHNGGVADTMKRLFGTAVIVASLSGWAMAQDTSDPAMSRTPTDATPMARTATEMETDRDFDLGWLGLLGLAGLAGLRRHRHTHPANTGTHVHDHTRTDRL